MRTIDPIFVTPRFVDRDWGRDDLGPWCRIASRPTANVGEVWLHDAANATQKGPLGRRLAQNPTDMLGDLGRAPPKLRLVFPGSATLIRSTTPLSLWTILDPGEGACEGAEIRHRAGERIRAFEGAALSLAARSVALEVSSAFQPSNRSLAQPSLVRLPPVSSRARATLFRDAALSVETWTLPELSRVEPDGETCHVLVALTPGMTVDGLELRQGEAIFIPAWGRPFDLRGARAKALVA